MKACDRIYYIVIAIGNTGSLLIFLLTFYLLYVKIYHEKSWIESQHDSSIKHYWNIMHIMNIFYTRGTVKKACILQLKSISV